MTRSSWVSLSVAMAIWVPIAIIGVSVMAPALPILDGPLPFVASIAFAACTLGVWLALAQVVVTCALHFLVPASSSTIGSARPPEERLAFLLCTRDDWIEETATRAVASMLPGDRLFLCDDSQDPRFRTAVDRFASRHAHQCQVVRRLTLDGYKAGNLNHVLRSEVKAGGFAYFVLLDHDTFVSTKAIDGATQLLRCEPQLAFVQLSVRDQDGQPSAFARDLRSLLAVSDWFHSIRGGFFGIAMCIGRGTVLRTEAVLRVGGFPTVLAEDVGLTLMLLREGLFGAQLSTQWVEEQIPESYERFLSRYARWCVGSLQAWFWWLRAGPKWHRGFLATIDLVAQGLSLFFPVWVLLYGLASLALVRYQVVTPNLDLMSRGTCVLALALPVLPMALVRKGMADRALSAVCECAIYLSVIMPVALRIAAMPFRTPAFVNTGNRLIVDEVHDQGGHDRRVAWELTAVAVTLLLIGSGPVGEGPLDAWMGVPVGLPLGLGALAHLVLSRVAWESSVARLARVLPVGGVAVLLVDLLARLAA